jgi:ribonuclease BN (tRNA processing enzyme)
MFERAFALTEYGVRQPFAAAGFEVTAIPVEHYDTPTWGLRVRGPSGRTVAFSADSGPCDALAELARGADLFVCEATLADASADGSLRGHLTLEEAVAAAGETRLLVTHRPSELPVPAARELAREGTVVDV